MRTLKSKYGIQSKKDLEDYQRTLKNTREEKYELYSHFNQSKERTRERTRDKTSGKEITKERTR